MEGVVWRSAGYLKRERITLGLNNASTPKSQARNGCSSPPVRIYWEGKSTI